MINTFVTVRDAEDEPDRAASAPPERGYAGTPRAKAALQRFHHYFFHELWYQGTAHVCGEGKPYCLMKESNFPFGLYAISCSNEANEDEGGPRDRWHVSKNRENCVKIADMVAYKRVHERNIISGRRYWFKVSADESFNKWLNGSLLS